MKSKNRYAYKAYIKDIYIELPGFKFRHKPLGETKNENFIGREDNIRNFLNILKNGVATSGAYLVTGFRGMGKTSFVNKVVKSYKRSKLPFVVVKDIKVSFGKADITHNEIIKQVIFSFKNRLLTKFEKRLLAAEKRTTLFFLMSFFCFLYFFFLLKIGPFLSDRLELFADLRKWIYSNPDMLTLWNLLKTFGGPVPVQIEIEGTWKFIFIPIIWSFLKGYMIVSAIRFINVFIFNIQLYKRLDILHNHAVAETVYEDNHDSTFSDVQVNFLGKKTQKKPPLTIKEVESELISIINGISQNGDESILEWNLRKLKEGIEKYIFQQRRKEFIFIFDELDKVDTKVFFDNLQQTTSDRSKYQNIKAVFEEVRERKQMMLVILSSLKYLITESRARFVFIAGREMYEAYLADMADRQSSISSIFHHVIYIDSFLNDQTTQHIGLTQMVENYMKKILFPPISRLTFREKRYREEYKRTIKSDSLYKGYNYMLTRALEFEHITEQERYKVIATLQQFVTYLTYRSNGSPKNLARLVEDLIIDESTTHGQVLSERKTNYSTDRTYSFLKTKIAFRKPVNPFRKERLFLHFSYYRQFRFGFISYLYRPYIITYGRKNPSSSDYLLVSTSYLMDHIIKYHPFAFSKRNLDLVPEMLAVNSSPQLRLLVEELLQFLSYSYLRDTETNLFEYKFFNKIANEIAYLSKVFEEESAAFNFTLDESYNIKLHIKNKILELRNIHKDFRTLNYDYIHSISALNNVLGDARFFDQEFDDAITAYSDALQSLRDIQDKCKNIELSLLCIKLQLKLGLTYEKTNANEFACVYYTQAIQTVNEAIETFFKKESQSLEAASVSVVQLFEIGFHAYIANLFIQERVSIEGVTIQKIQLTEKALLFALEKCRQNDAKNSLKIIEANIYSNIATLLHYNNYAIKGTNDISLPNDQQLFQQLQINDTGIDFRFSILSLRYCYKSTLQLINYNSSDLPDPAAGNFQLNLLLSLFEIIQNQKLSSYSNNEYLKALASITSRIGDIILSSMADTTKSVSIDVLSPIKVLFYYVVDKVKGSPTPSEAKIDILPVIKKLNPELHPLCYVIAFYFASSKFYSRARKHTSCSFQLRKTLRVVNHLVDFGDDSKVKLNNDIIRLLEEMALKEILINTSNTSNGTDRPQILNLKHYFDICFINTPQSSSKWLYANISNSPEVKEGLLLYAKLRIKIRYLKWKGWNNESVPEDLNDLYPEQSLVTPNNTITQQWVRLMELNIQFMMNRAIIENYLCPGISEFIKMLDKGLLPQPLTVYWHKTLYNEFAKLNLTDVRKQNLRGLKSTNDFARFYRRLRGFYSKHKSGSDFLMITRLVRHFSEVVASSIYCLNHSIHIVQTYSATYPIGLISVGDLHRRLGIFMELYHLAKILELIFLERDINSIEQMLNDLIRPEILNTLDATSQYQLAKTYYYKVLSMHTSGDVFKSNFRELNYLEDDFNDNLNHFIIALERQRINSGNVRKHLRMLEDILEQSKLFSYQSFVDG